MPFFRFAATMLCLALLVLSTGCFPKVTLPPEPVRPVETAQALERRADAAWQARNYAESARLYGQLAWERQEDLDPRSLPVIRERLVQSLVRIRNYDQAIGALHRWAGLDPLIRDQWFWHDHLVRSWLGQGRRAEAAAHLAHLLRRPDASWELRSSAGANLVEVFQQAGNYSAMAEILAETFALAPDDASRIQLERMAMHIAKGLSDTELRALVRGIDEGEEWGYPYSFFFWEQQRRVASREPGTWSDAWSTLQRLLQRGEWADRAPLTQELEELQRSFGDPGMCLGLVLPLDGPLAETGWKILRGAEAGRRVLFLEGVEIRLEVLNALDSGLVDNLRNLDTECTLVGGPVQRDTWQRIHGAQLHRERVFFTFLPSLGDAREGQEAWRFFSSPQDQVRALAELSIKSLGITSSGVLYPEDGFGRHMMDLFTQEVAAQGGIVRKIQGYPPREHDGWGEMVASLLGVQAQQRRGRAEEVQLPEPGFQALFVPDSLTQAEMLIPQLFYYDEPRLLLMGPELWSQAWGRRAGQIETQYFRLAVMPGAWWPDNPSLATKNLIRFAAEYGAAADFWMALGYDFVRWAGTLGHSLLESEMDGMNAVLTRHGNFQWSMAPLRWDPEGIVRQDLYLFQPGLAGLSLVDPEGLRLRLERTRRLHQR